MELLEEKVVVVTGVASGIGRALAMAFAEQGCRLALVDIDDARLLETADFVTARVKSCQISTHLCDVSDRAAMAQLPEGIVAEHGGIHILCNNAGVTMTKSFEESSMQDLDFVLGINLWGVLYGCHYFLPYLKKQGEGHIVNTSSLAAYMGMPTQSTYCLTKAAVKSLSESLRVELAQYNIGVTSIHPGTIRTNILRNAVARSHADGDKTAKLMGMMDRFGLPPEKLAVKVVGAVKKNRMQVRIGADAYLADWAKRLFPRAIHLPLQLMFEKSL